MELCIKTKHFSIFWALLLVHCVHIGEPEYLPPQVDYLFHEIHAKGFEGMLQLVNPWVKKSTELRKAEFAIGSSVEIENVVQKAFMIAFCRSNHDGVVQNLIQHIQSKTSTKANFYDTISAITKKAIRGLRNTQRSPVERATYYTVLENVNETLTPYISKHPPARRILEMIAKARLRIPESVHNTRYIHALESKTHSPSSVAHYLLRKNPAEE